MRDREAYRKGGADRDRQTDRQTNRHERTRTRKLYVPRISKRKRETETETERQRLTEIDRDRKGKTEKHIFYYIRERDAKNTKT